LALFTRFQGWRSYGPKVTLDVDLETQMSDAREQTMTVLEDLIDGALESCQRKIAGAAKTSSVAS